MKELRNLNSKDSNLVQERLKNSPKNNAIQKINLVKDLIQVKVLMCPILLHLNDILLGY